MSFAATSHSARVRSGTPSAKTPSQMQQNFAGGPAAVSPGKVRRRGMQARYRFLTTWCLGAPIEPVWDALHCVEKWPEWWKGVERVEKLEAGDDDGIGSVYRHRWRSRLPYTVGFDMRTTRIERPFLLEGHARGELEGVGRWRLYEGEGTAATYEWDVRTTPPWMNAIAPVARPVFVWSHNVVMRWGGEGLARLLGARLLALS